MTTLISRIDYPEIFIGFVAPIGTDIAPTLAFFRKYFESHNYDVQEIRVTDAFSLFEDVVDPPQPLIQRLSFERYDTHIKYGNHIRAHFEEPSILALTAIKEIRRRRPALASDLESTVYSKRVFLLHQFKRPEEVDLMRTVYGRLFFQVSVYSRRGARVDYLSRKFASARNSADLNSYRGIAESIVQIDENQSSVKFGQRVSKIFHDADLIINNDLGSESVEKQIARFCDLLFSSNSISPTKVEYGMYAAKAAALRTLDLSRQVGAAIFRKSGEVISMGSNEVPRAQGGTYWCDETFDDRDYKRRVDSNDRRKMELLRELVAYFVDEEAVEGDIETKGLRQSQIMDALEYGRVVHAEMVAICDAARLGIAVKGAHLFTTTFPCHMCAKHVIASGIEEVTFLEPYPKSLAFDLHADAIQVEGGDRGQYEDFPFTKFLHFHGITPRRYRELFERAKRKDKDGNFREFGEGSPRFFLEYNEPHYTNLEELVVQTADQKTGKVNAA